MKFFSWYLAAAFCGLGGPVLCQTLLIDQTDLRPSNLPQQFIASEIEPPVGAAGGSAVRAGSKRIGADLLNSLVARGISQGFGGLIYENRDRDHSPVKREEFPALTHLKYGPVLYRSRADYGLAGAIVVPLPLIGNSSTARTGSPTWRSLTRLAMTTTIGPARSYSEYAANSLYVYPEHRDHDDWDLFPANWPYTITSQGSSGSDQRFVHSLLMTAAAFPADTRQALVNNGLFASTLQMIMRRNLKGVDSNSMYMSAVAHPSVFEQQNLRPERMISHAAGLQPGDIPPMVRLEVLSEDFGQQAGLMNSNEHLFSTPSAIARLWHDHKWQRELTVSAENTVEPNGRELTYFWTILRGNPQKIEIEPLNKTGSQARISVMWHDAYLAPPLAVSGQNVRPTSRVDIGVFAYNGVSISAPAFVSVNFPTHQKRAYERDERGQIRIASIDYNAADRNARYDPVLFWEADWRDEFVYGVNGEPTGWRRISSAGELEFRADGRLADGRLVEHKMPDRIQKQMSVTFEVVGE